MNLKDILSTCEPHLNIHFSGLYIIYCVRSEFLYIGQTESFKKRFSEHKTKLNSGRHHNEKLQKLFDEYGMLSFVFLPYKFCLSENLLEEEKKLIESVEANILLNGYSSNKPKPKRRIKTSMRFVGVGDNQMKVLMESLKNGEALFGAAKKAGIETGTAYRIMTGKIYKSKIKKLGFEEVLNDSNLSAISSNVKDDLIEGLSYSEIEGKYSIDARQFRLILSDKTWPSYTTKKKLPNEIFLSLKKDIPLNLGGTYMIYNKTSNKAYIGKTKCFVNRFAKHTSDLVSKIHSNKELQNLWNEDSGNFLFCPIREVENPTQIHESVDAFRFDENSLLNKNSIFPYIKFPRKSAIKKASEARRLLTEEDFSKLLEMLEKNVKHVEIAKTLRVQTNCIYSILQGTTYQDLIKKAGYSVEEFRLKFLKGGVKRVILNEISVSEIKKRINNKEKIREIAMDYKISFTTVEKIRKSKIWKNVEPLITYDGSSKD